MSVQLAHLYATLCLAQVFFQVALIAGAPLGGWAEDGHAEGALSMRARTVAAIAIPVLLFQALAVLSAAGFPGLGWPRWTGWLAVGVQGALFGLDLLSRAPAGRRLWAPFNAVMAGLALAVMTS